MSSSKPLSGPAKISETTFIGIHWGGVALGLIFIAARFGVRINAFRRLYADDGLVFLAWLVLFISSVLWQVSKDYLYENIAVSSGQLYPLPANFPKRTETYLRRSVAVIIFFYTGLWAIKLSFLIFFRRLGQNVRNQKIVWWTVLVITVASYFACVGTIEYHCLTGSFIHVATQCIGPKSVSFQRNTLRWNMIMDVFTDILIILVPVNMLWKVQISLRQKIALTGIFSITFIIMVFAVIRVVVVSATSQQPDQTWLYMWSSIEQTVSIIVACLASFRTLFTKSNSKPPKGIEAGESKTERSTSARLALLFGSIFTKSSAFTKASKEGRQDSPQNSIPPMPPALTSIHASNNGAWHQYSGSFYDSQAQAPFKGVHVRHEINVSKGVERLVGNVEGLPK